MSVRTVPMPKRKPPANEGSPSPEKVSTKLKAALHRAKTVAAWRGVDLEDYLDAILSPIVDRDFADLMKADQEAGK